MKYKLKKQFLEDIADGAYNHLSSYMRSNGIYNTIDLATIKGYTQDGLEVKAVLTPTFFSRFRKLRSKMNVSVHLDPISPYTQEKAEQVITSLLKYTLPKD